MCQRRGEWDSFACLWDAGGTGSNGFRGGLAKSFHRDITIGKHAEWLDAVRLD